jgi:hypothetical protein
VRTLIVLMLLARTASAETRTEHYRTTIAVIDGASLATLLGGAVLLPENKPAGIVALAVGGAVYMLGSPIAHYVKQETKDKYYASLLMRVAAVGVFGGIGGKLGEGRCPADDKNCDDIAVGFAIGAGVGAVIVSALDIALLAKRQVAVVPTSGGAMVGIAGRF